MGKFRYSDEADRAYGATGMAIGLMVYDGEELLYSINLDAAPGDMMELSPDFFFAGNPGVSAKTAWNRLVKNYSIGLSMLIGNVMCRYIVNSRRDVPADVTTELKRYAHEEGAGSCELEDDEIDRVFDKSFDYLRRVFTHRGVQAVAHDFASALTNRRSLSRLEIEELLSSLRML